jgi:hypothetical protein
VAVNAEQLANSKLNGNSHVASNEADFLRGFREVTVAAYRRKFPRFELEDLKKFSG